MHKLKLIAGLAVPAMLFVSCASDAPVVEDAAPTTLVSERHPDLPVQAQHYYEHPREGIEDYAGFADIIAVGTFSDIEDSVWNNPPDPDDPRGTTTDFAGLTFTADTVLKGEEEIEVDEDLPILVADRLLDDEEVPFSALAPYVEGLAQWEDLVDGGRFLIFLSGVNGGDEAPWMFASSKGVMAVDEDDVITVLSDAVPSEARSSSATATQGYTDELVGLTVDEARPLVEP